MKNIKRKRKTKQKWWHQFTSLYNARKKINVNPRKRCYIIYSESKNQFRVCRGVYTSIFHVKPRSDLLDQLVWLNRKNLNPLLSAINSVDQIQVQCNRAFGLCHAYMWQCRHDACANVMADKSKWHLNFRRNPCFIHFTRLLHIMWTYIYKLGVFFFFFISIPLLHVWVVS